MADSKSNTLSLLNKEEENAHHRHHHHHLSILTTTTSSSHSSSFSCSSPSSTLEDSASSVSSKKIRDINVGDHVGDEDEIGYHTPTSPEHRIRPSVDCPPAPKKPNIEDSQRRKRKASWSSVKKEWFRLELMSSIVELDGVWLMKKKVRSEEEINENY